MRTVALAGFAELVAATLAAAGGKTSQQAVAAVADVYLGFTDAAASKGQTTDDARDLDVGAGDLSRYFSVRGSGSQERDSAMSSMSQNMISPGR